MASEKLSHASVTVSVVRDRKIRTALRTNQIAEFVTVTAWKKINEIMYNIPFQFIDIKARVWKGD